ncbi:MAG: SDR family NAD(P)-dependent oxidoreductase [Isosphaeraceae bacterium]
MNDVGERKVVLVTGASAGLGAEVARVLAERGDHLVLTARRSERLQRIATEAETLGQGGESLVIAADLDDPTTPGLLVEKTLDRFGRLDVLVNNAGFGLPTLFADGDPEALRRQLAVNLVAPMLLARMAIPALLETRGTIINVGSAISCLANPALGAYGATKAGLAYWNNALRRELWHKGVTVCLVEPGPVRTEFFHALVSQSATREYHPMLDAPSEWMTAEVNQVARRIVGLIDRPRRRLSVTRRFVWPWRATGTLLEVIPALGDLAVSWILRTQEKKGPSRRPSAESLNHASRVD